MVELMTQKNMWTIARWRVGHLNQTALRLATAILKFVTALRPKKRSELKTVLMSQVIHKQIDGEDFK